MRPLVLLIASLCSLTAEPLRFRITLDPKIAPKGASGRLFVFLDKGDTPRDTIKVGFLPEGVWMAAKEVTGWKAGATVDLDPDELAFPAGFSTASKDSYVVMALLDTDHTFARERQDPGDLVSGVKVLKDWVPAAGGVVPLTLSAVTPEEKPPADTANIQYVSFRSSLLSAFWGRPIVMNAGVVLPKGAGMADSPLPAVYHVHGFGGSYREAWAKGEGLVEAIATGEKMRAVHVYLDGNCPGGHHVFADSVNNGPWGQALTTELIPYLEREFHLVATPQARFVTGHSSGGWSTLWLQVRYPEYFGGAWPTAPDSVDFRSFTGIDATPQAVRNAYRSSSGQPLNLVRMDGKDVMSMEEFARMELVTGEYGGQLASFEWVFSPRGPDGRPLPLFDRSNGELYANGAREYWQQYDIAQRVRENWGELGPKLLGKIRLVIGDSDNFHLNESALLFCGWLKEKGREDACEIIPDRDHFTLHRPYKTYPNGLLQRIDDEMRAQWEKSQRAPR
ncbi:MAG TPA: alpha/beta hydrolase-fold protein [Bryobacteraceae bacterium]|nr:alpha/beta hydrolase-fold protein [Bryobacteraceae bacterium]